MVSRDNALSVLIKKYNLIDRFISDDVKVCLRGEANIAACQLICVAIETYGRIFLGYKDNTNVSELAFRSFLTKFFPEKYGLISDELYKNYRCGLLHSYVLGFSSKKGFYPTRTNRDASDFHLGFTDKQNHNPTMKKDENHYRLIINIDKLNEDLRGAANQLKIAILTKSSYAGFDISRKGFKVKNGSHYDNAMKSLTDL